ncbi:glycosyltransferase [Lewinellaceae bacterium SD302]|nr:glycosyltransferase [Lewinellaceae bacterium SD302]
MNAKRHTLDFVFIGKSILSSFNNPQADLYRGLVGELAHLGHRTVFLEQEDPCHRKQRDMLRSPYCEVWTYGRTQDLLTEYRDAIRVADVVLLGNGVHDSSRIAHWIAEEAKGAKVYYDTDLARTFGHLDGTNKRDDCLEAADICLFDLFLSTTGGTAIQRICDEFNCPMAFPLYESIDPYFYYRTDVLKQYDLGFIGNFKQDRDQQLNEMLLQPAIRTPNRNFVLAGANYPDDFNWPDNMRYVEHLPESNHVSFYNRQHCSLVLARPDRAKLGHTPSKRLLAAAACGVPILSDDWEGLPDFFEPNREIFVISDCHSVLDALYISSEFERSKLGDLARERVLAEHTTRRRTEQLLELCGMIMA